MSRENSTFIRTNPQWWDVQGKICPKRMSWESSTIASTRDIEVGKLDPCLRSRHEGLGQRWGSPIPIFARGMWIRKQPSPPLKVNRSKSLTLTLARGMEVEKLDLVQPICINRWYEGRVNNGSPPTALEEVILNGHAKWTCVGRYIVHDGLDVLNNLIPNELNMPLGWQWIEEV